MRIRSRFFACLLLLFSVPDRSQTTSAADELKRLAFVSPVAPSTVLPAEAAFWRRLGELGWIEGKNIVFAKYFGDGDRDRLPILMTEALRASPDVIVTPGTQGALEAKRATTKVPIVSLMGDPVGTGLVASLSRPGGNLTGVSVQNAEELPTKWIELLRELQPHLSRVALIVNPDNLVSTGVTTQIGRAASALGIKLIILEARRPEDFRRVIEQARQRAQALIVWPDSIAIHSRRLIAAQATRHRLPAVYGQSDFVDAGGLISYGPDLAALWRRVGDYVDKILKGTNPAELPIEQPITFDLVVNLQAARAIGVTIPDSVLARANKVVQ